MLHVVLDKCVIIFFCFQKNSVWYYTYVVYKPRIQKITVVKFGINKEDGLTGNDTGYLIIFYTFAQKPPMGGSAQNLVFG